MKKIKVIGFAGIVNGKIDTGWQRDKEFKDGLYGIFKTRKEAREKYEGVIKVEIKQI